MPEMDWGRNNLDKAGSRYLQQHARNPVWWQQWSSAALDHAERTKQPILVSVGYSTCHWCHVMAREAFSDAEVAELLNRHFVCIKVDREERPDIDKVLMDFLVATTGSGGWPLNAFLSPAAEPVFAMTYAGLEQRGPVPPFPEILRRILAHLQESGQTYGPLNGIAAASDDGSSDPAASAHAPAGAETGSRGLGDAERAILDRYDRALQSAVDDRFGGFGRGAKFPPHSALIAALHRKPSSLASAPSVEAPAASVPAAKATPEWVEPTLAEMCYGGLRDYAAGGFFRYTVDREWRVPHFEKMLYDQAGLLWALSLAGVQSRDRGTRAAWLGIATEVREFLHAGLRAPGAVLFSSGLNAETAGQEGGSYLVDSGTKLPEPFAAESLPRVEGRLHLVPRFPEGTPVEQREAILRAARAQLRKVRVALPQPERDDKLITEWNALAVCGLLSYARAATDPEAAADALSVLEVLCSQSWTERGISRLAGQPDSGNFLSDAAALGLAISLATELNPIWLPRLLAIGEVVNGFRSGGKLLSARSVDFVEVPASGFDSPSPSERSLVAVLETRLAWQTGTLPPGAPVPRALANDFALIAWLHGTGIAASVGLPKDVPLEGRLAIHPAVLITQAPAPQSCRDGVCTPGISPDLRHPEAT